MRSDALIKAQQTLREVEATMRDREETMDDLTERIASIRFSSTARNPLKKIGTPGPLSRLKRSFSGSSAMSNIEIPADIREEVTQAAEARKARKAKLASITTTRTNRISLDDLMSTPLDMDSLPDPGVYVPEAESENAPPPASTPTPAPTASQSTAFGGFGGISFHLNPTSAATSNPALRTHNARGGGGTRRSHASAPKFRSATSEAPPAAAGDLSFTPPLATGQKSAAPSGFFR